MARADTVARRVLTEVGGADLEHTVDVNRPEHARAAPNCTTATCAESVPAGQGTRRATLGVKGSQVQILSSRRQIGRCLLNEEHRPSACLTCDNAAASDL